MTAFFGEPKLKAALLDRLYEHRRMDQIAQGFYFRDGRGCQLGCITHDEGRPHEMTEQLFGIPVTVAYLLEAVFEGLPADECVAWVTDSIEAIPVGADLTRFHHRFSAWQLGESGLLTVTDINRAAIADVVSLHNRAANGETITPEDWSAAWSARSAAWSVAESAWSVADSARSAAWSVADSAESAAWMAIAANTIRLFKTSPIGAEKCPECVEETMQQLSFPAGITNPPLTA